MYTHPEIDLIFQNCGTWSELEKVCTAFCYLINIGEMSTLKTFQIRQLSTQRFRELENL
jgi:hypothetical protein